MSTDDVPLYCSKQKFGKFNVYLVLRKINGKKATNKDKLVSVFSTKKEALSFINVKQGW